jgi:hypothetical protein
MKHALIIAAISEVATGLALLIAPSLGNCFSVRSLPGSRYLWRA